MHSKLIESVDQVIDNFNRRKMDLPDGFFDRRAQFVINGATFDSLLSSTPNDPLVMMLARGAAGYRFTAKALQHAMPDATIERSSIPERQLDEAMSTGAGDRLAFALRLSGALRGTGEKVSALARIAVVLNAAGHVTIAEATIDAGELQKIREARLRT